jgi:hypothetical protein
MGAITEAEARRTPTELLKRAMIGNDEPAALELLYRLELQYGWVATAMTRKDVETELGRELTPAEWDEMQRSYAWRKGIQEVMVEAAFNEIRAGLVECGITSEATE